MHALRRIHQALVPGGVLLDMHPVPPSTRAEVRGGEPRRVRRLRVQRLVADAERVLERSGLFARESEVEFDYLESYDDPAQLLEDIDEGWDGCNVPPELEGTDPPGRRPRRHLGAGRPTPLPRSAQVTDCY